MIGLHSLIENIDDRPTFISREEMIGLLSLIENIDDWPTFINREYR